SKKDLVAELKVQLSKAEARYKQTRKLDELKRQIKKLMAQYAWAQIEVEEQKIRDEEAVLEQKKARVENAYNKINEHEKIYAKAKDAYNQSVEIHERVKEEAAPLKEKSADLLE